jgi:putative redox protein
MKVRTEWKEKMSFDSQLDGHSVLLDAGLQSGGDDKGPRPKALLLTALSGCTGMDVVSMLKKMRVENYKFWMEMDADMTTEHPKVYSKIYMNYFFEGEKLPFDKIQKAVTLSEEKYCGVSAMLKKACDIEIKIFINGELHEQI